MTAKLTGAACRAARGILKWSVRDLAREASISPTTVNLLEADRPYRDATAEKITQAFVEHDVEITNGAGTGARLRLGRLELHTALEEIVLALVRSERPAPAAAEVCRLIKADARVTRDLLSDHLRRDIAELDGGRPPGTYGQAAQRLIPLLSAAARPT